MSELINLGDGLILEMPTEEEDRKLMAAALSDPDAQPMADDAKLVPYKRRGRPSKETTKVQMTVRFSPEVIEHFKAGGDGWQTRMDEVLLKHVKKQAPKKSA